MNVPPIGSGPTVLLMDVDGVVSPIHGTTHWGDDVPALPGSKLSMPVSPRMCAHLDRIGQREDVTPYWLSTWDASMRSRLETFPGKDWDSLPSVSPSSASTFRGWSIADVWWKWAVLAQFVRETSPSRVVWCDDKLDQAAAPGTGPHGTSLIGAWLTQNGVANLLIAPLGQFGLSPDHLRRVERWLTPADQDPHGPSP